MTDLMNLPNNLFKNSFETGELNKNQIDFVLI